MTAPIATGNLQQTQTTQSSIQKKKEKEQGHCLRVVLEIYCVPLMPHTARTNPINNTNESHIHFK